MRRTHFAATLSTVPVPQHLVFCPQEAAAAEAEAEERRQAESAAAAEAQAERERKLALAEKARQRLADEVRLALENSPFLSFVVRLLSAFGCLVCLATWLKTCLHLCGCAGIATISTFKRAFCLCATIST